MTTTTTHPYDQFSCSVETITPAMAEVYLKDVGDNPRTPRPIIVSKYARDISSGDWHLGAGFVAFNTRGSLVQGQHTCLAVVESGQAIRMVVYRNVTDAAVKAMDQHLKRTAGQILRGEIKNSYSTVAALNVAWRWEAGRILYSDTPTIDESLMWLAAHPGFEDAVTLALPLANRPLAFKVSVAGAFVYVGSVLYPDAIEDFVDALHTGEGLVRGNPILTVRDVLLKQASAPHNTTGTRQLALVIKAWNAWVRGDDLKLVKWLKGESFPVMVGPNGETLFPSTVAPREAEA